jgi:hypothetical protein
VVRRNPAETPSHPFANGFDFFDRRAGHDRVGNIVVFEMWENSFDVIHFQRATHASRRLSRTKHEVLDE